jgi:hypothetical protein
MNPRRITPACMAIFSAAAVAAAEPALAARPGSKTGYNVFHCETQTLALGENHSLTTIRARGLVVTTPASADHMADIDCMGTIESMPGNAFKASGYCVLTDRDGDKWLDRWWTDSTMPKGRWEDVGLTGKWRGTRATGQYVYTDRSGGSQCKGISAWEEDR